MALSMFGGVGGGRFSHIFDPFSLDIWDPFDFPFSGAVTTSSRTNNEAAQIVNARVDWKETPNAHLFKVDLPRAQERGGEGGD